MVTDHKGRIIYVTSKLAELLGSSAKGLLRTDFSRLMAQPFMQLHSKWMKVRYGWYMFPACCCFDCVGCSEHAAAGNLAVQQQHILMLARFSSPASWRSFWAAAPRGCCERISRGLWRSPSCSCTASG
jgi:hypothetical protein